MSAVNDPDNVVIKTLARLTHNLPLGRGLSPKPVARKGWTAHREAVTCLSYNVSDVPEGHRIRLKKNSAKDTGEAGDGVVELDGSALNGVIAIDPVNATADVEGMCTYEDLVDATLSFGFVPLVTPHLKTRTIGAAVTGLDVGATTFRHGLPHESVLEMDILTGSGEVLTCSPTENPELYRGFPNSYGTLGYAVRLKIELEPVLDYVALRNVRFHDLATLTAVMADVVETGRYAGRDVDCMDGVVFSPTEAYLMMGTQTAEPGPVSDYTQEEIYYRSIQHEQGITQDRLTIRDYIWRWDTNLFWGTNPLGVRRIWSRDLLRSSFYSKLMELEHRYQLSDRFSDRFGDRAGRAALERVVQDVQVSADTLVDFLDWFFATCEISPLWICPIRLHEGGVGGGVRAGVPGAPGGITGGSVRDGSSGEVPVVNPPDVTGARPWALSPLTRGTTWVNVGFWSTVPVDLLGEDGPDHAFNRAIEDQLTRLGGHKSLYSDVFYARADFEELYGGVAFTALKEQVDPGGRFPGLYEKIVQQARVE